MGMFNGTNPINQTPIVPGQQVVIPQITIPNNVGNVISRPQPPVNQLTIRGGEKVARQFKLPPNSRAAIFDEEEPIFYFKETDENGNEIAFKKCSYVEIEDPPEPEYLTVQEFKSVLDDFKKSLKEEFFNGQSVHTQKQPESRYGNDQINTKSYTTSANSK